MTTPTNGGRYERLIADAAHSLPTIIHCTKAGIDCMRSLTGMVARQMGVENPTEADHIAICRDIEQHALDDVALIAGALPIIIIPIEREDI